MAHETIKRTISGEEDQRVIVDNLHPPLVRKMIIGSDWTKLRILARISLNTSKANGNYAGYPPNYFGLCAGTSAPPGNSMPNHFIGLKSNSALKVYDNYFYLSRGTSYDSCNPFPCTIRNGSESNGSYINFSYHFARSAATLPSLYGITFTKSSPTSLSCDAYIKETASVDDFKNAMESMDDVPSNMDGDDDFTRAVDEATYGALDTVCFAFLGASDTFEISDIDYARLA